MKRSESYTLTGARIALINLIEDFTTASDIPQKSKDEIKNKIYETLRKATMKNCDAIYQMCNFIHIQKIVPRFKSADSTKLISFWDQLLEDITKIVLNISFDNKDQRKKETYKLLLDKINELKTDSQQAKSNSTEQPKTGPSVFGF